MHKTKPILIDLPTSIETPRLLLRPPHIGEGTLLNAAVIESFEMLHKFMPWAKEKPSLDDSEEVVRKAVANWILTCDIDNEQSKKIPEKLGYKLEATLRENRIKPVSGEITDTLVYARNNLSGIPELEVKW